MIQKVVSMRRIVLALAGLLALLCATMPAFAEIDSGLYQVVQGGVAVGTIYVPVRGPDPSIYAEYWVLTSQYVYPSPANLVTTDIVPLYYNPYTSLADFLRNVPWAEGYRFVTAINKDTGVLPRPVTGD